jgi:predicted dehydrogenase
MTTSATAASAPPPAPAGPVRFAVVGGGWRTAFFLRVAAALPERFRLEGVVVRDPRKGAAFEAQSGVPTFRTPAALLGGVDPEFLVASVSAAANFEVNLALLATGLPLLTETPPAATLEQMHRLWDAAGAAGGVGRVQVAEQFHLQPLHAARLAAVRAGRIGPPHTVSLSVCHGYHGVSLIRHYLDAGFQPARIVGRQWQDRALDAGGRAGPPAAPRVSAQPQQIALLDFAGGGQAVFDFTGSQYFSPIRRQRVCVRGERGEIVDRTLYAYAPPGDGGDPVVLDFRRHAAGPEGNLEGQHLKGIQLGDSWIYRNPLAPARLADEEVAVGDLLARMGAYVRARGAPDVRPPYPLAQGLQDHYLGLLIRQACESGQPVAASPQPWAA